MKTEQPFFFTLALTALAGLSGCSQFPSSQSDSVAQNPPAQFAPLTHLYDYHLIDRDTREPTNLPGLVKKLAHADVIFVGEYHGNQASHLLQAQLQAALFAQHPNQILSLEQFERDDQAVIERYLESQIGEKTLTDETDAWPNYTGSYRPMIEFAKRHFLPVVAANAPGRIVRCVGRHGPDYLNRLPPNQRDWVAQNPFYDPPGYQPRFFEFVTGQAHGESTSPKKTDVTQRQRQSYQAQLLRDNTMAESLLNAKRDHPDAQILHLNGAFHSDEFLGTVAALAQRAPQLRIAVISPVRIEPEQAHGWLAQADEQTFEKGDFLYLIQPQPAEYVQAQKRRAAMQKQFKQAEQKPCLPMRTAS
ncbi:ChaN family lipoprotein [Hydrogenovibrio halophilus]|uniref:ChaN family lipoprotein n=1 Tax=Hydrogenovibrio halophilus TaxID=373391 RepID=UPI0003719305|nr:ChaN family lipoprotein [Hydrogenovibrio halophilus]